MRSRIGWGVPLNKRRGVTDRAEGEFMFAAPPVLNLIVLRSDDIDRAADFYVEMGLLFIKHRHGQGPEHYVAEMNGLTFEIYPTGPHGSTEATRLGFSVDDVDSIVDLLVKAGAELLQPPHESSWGRRATMKDFDGHTVELLTPPNRDRVVASTKTSTGVITESHIEGMSPGDFDRS
ncbi:MAG: VOC family protein [Planctomycetota bacterium]